MSGPAFGLYLFLFDDGTEFGIGTWEEFDGLVAEGVAPAGSYRAALTAEQAETLLAA